MKEREKEEASKMAAMVAMTATKSIVAAGKADDHKVEDAAPAASSMLSTTVKAQNPVCLNRQLGIAGLFNDCSEVKVYEGGGSEASTT